MTPKIVPLLDQCIETGIQLGWQRAHKHTDNPTQDEIHTQIYQCIWSELDAWFDFPEPPNE
jgi:hypothetical protein